MAVMKNGFSVVDEDGDVLSFYPVDEGLMARGKSNGPIVFITKEDALQLSLFLNAWHKGE